MTEGENGPAEAAEAVPQSMLRQLEGAIRVCEAGTLSRSDARRQRNVELGRRALRMAEKWKERLVLSENEQGEIERKMMMLVEVLERLQGRAKAAGA